LWLNRKFAASITDVDGEAKREICRWCYFDGSAFG